MEVRRVYSTIPAGAGWAVVLGDETISVHGRQYQAEIEAIELAHAARFDHGESAVVFHNADGTARETRNYQDYRWKAGGDSNASSEGE